jgi:hypothetical protein
VVKPITQQIMSLALDAGGGVGGGGVVGGAVGGGGGGNVGGGEVGTRWMR